MIYYKYHKCWFCLKHLINSRTQEKDIFAEIIT